MEHTLKRRENTKNKDSVQILARLLPSPFSMEYYGSHCTEGGSEEPDPTVSPTLECFSVSPAQRKLYRANLWGPSAWLVKLMAGVLGAPAEKVLGWLLRVLSLLNYHSLLTSL